MNQINNKEYVLIFDGVCMLCNSAVHFLHKRLKYSDYNFIPSESDIGKEYIKRYNLGKLTDNTLVLIVNDDIFIKSKAVFVILNDMPLLWKLLRIFKLLPSKLLDRLYDMIAKNRYLFFGNSSGESCYHEIE